MQNFATPHAPAQHLPAGWSFPATSPAVPPAPAVTGGGAATSTITRVRWGRLLFMAAGVILLAVGAWSALSSSPASKGSNVGSATPAMNVSGGGANEVTLARTSRLDAAKIAPKANRRIAKARVTKRPIVRRSAARIAGGGAIARTTIPASAAAATTARHTVAGGGGNAQLPYTGAESWIAAILGLIALALGICFHVNAVRIGMTAMLYRRGILLRPIDCARLAHSRGFPRARVLLSNLLHRLLEEPANGDEFVSARYA